MKKYDDKGKVKPQKDYIYGCIASMLKTPKCQMLVEEEVCHQQENRYDCVVFAMAFATALVNNKNPTDCVFYEGKMRDHLKKCLIDNKMTMFPLRKETKNKEKPIKRSFIEINCNEKCQKPEFYKMGKERTDGERMAEC